MTGELVRWTEPNTVPKETQQTFDEHTFTFAFDESLPICGYATFDVDAVCVCLPRHQGPCFMISGYAHFMHPDFRVVDCVCHDD